MTDEIRRAISAPSVIHAEPVAPHTRLSPRRDAIAGSGDAHRHDHGRPELAASAASTSQTALMAPNTVHFAATRHPNLDEEGFKLLEAAKLALGVADAFSVPTGQHVQAIDRELKRKSMDELPPQQRELPLDNVRLNSIFSAIAESKPLPPILVDGRGKIENGFHRFAASQYLRLSHIWVHQPTSPIHRAKTPWRPGRRRPERQLSTPETRTQPLASSPPRPSRFKNDENA